MVCRGGRGGGDLMTHNCRKLEKYLFPGISGCIFDPCTGGPGESSYLHYGDHDDHEHEDGKDIQLPVHAS